MAKVTPEELKRVYKKEKDPPNVKSRMGAINAVCMNNCSIRMLQTCSCSPNRVSGWITI